METKIKFRNKKNRRHIITVDIVKERSLYEFLDNNNEWEIYIPKFIKKTILCRG